MSAKVLMSNRKYRAAGASTQRGITLPMALMGLVVMLFASLALVRSMDASLFLAGNMAFKRDLVNQAERGIAKAMKKFTASSGALYTETARTTSLTSSNYSATTLATDARGVPLALLNNTTFSTYGTSSEDIVDGAVTIRYLIDRQCSGTGSYALGTCVLVPLTDTPIGMDARGTAKSAGSEYRPVYRISIRVTGPRGTEVYVQSTVSI